MLLPGSAGSSRSESVQPSEVACWGDMQADPVSDDGHFWAALPK